MTEPVTNDWVVFCRDCLLKSQTGGSKRFEGYAWFIAVEGFGPPTRNHKNSFPDITSCIRGKHDLRVCRANSDGEWREHIKYRGVCVIDPQGYEKGSQPWFVDRWEKWK